MVGRQGRFNFWVTNHLPRMTRAWPAHRFAVWTWVLAMALIVTSCAGPTPSSSPQTGQVVVTDKNGRAPIVLTIVDSGGQLAGFRSATPVEIDPHLALIGFDDRIAAVDLGTQGREILVLWAGLICDRTATLTVDAEANAVAIAPDAIGGCDLPQMSRGVVLLFVNSRAVESMRVTLKTTPLIEEPS